MISRILAVDPGLMSGLALGVWADGALVDFRSWEKPTWDAIDEVYRFAWDTQEPDRDRMVVVESWTPRPGVRTFQPQALESIGAARYLCRRATAVEFKLQRPADAKSFGTNAKLKQLGWKNPSKGGHADDAARHLLVAAVDRRLIDAGIFLG